MSAHLGEQGPPVGLRALAHPLSVVPGHARGHVVMWFFYPIPRFECFSPPGAFIGVRAGSWLGIWNQKFRTSLSSSGLSLIKECPEIIRCAFICLSVRLLS